MTAPTPTESELRFLRNFAAGQPENAMVVSAAPIGAAGVFALARGLEHTAGATLLVVAVAEQSLRRAIATACPGDRVMVEEPRPGETTADALRRLPPGAAHALVWEDDAAGLDEADALAGLRPDGVLLRRSRIGHGFTLLPADARDAGDVAARMFESIESLTSISPGSPGSPRSFRPGNLVMGAIANYPRRKIEPFVRSLRRSGYEGTVVLFTMDVPPEVPAFLEENGCHALRAEPSPNYRHFPVNCLRYYLYRRFLERFGGEFSGVFLTDVGDVVFQADVFAHLVPGRLAVFAESNDIGGEPWNAGWVANLYGPETLARLAALRVACSGTTLAETPVMLDYLRAMTRELLPLQVALVEEAHPGTGMHGFDQGVHNYLLRTGGTPPFDLRTNDDAVVYTHDGRCQVLPDGRVATPDGRPYAVLHQYNRAPKLQRAILERIARLDGGGQPHA